METITVSNGFDEEAYKLKNSLETNKKYLTIKISQILQTSKNNTYKEALLHKVFGALAYYIERGSICEYRKVFLSILEETNSLLATDNQRYWMNEVVTCFNSLDDNMFIAICKDSYNKTERLSLLKIQEKARKLGGTGELVIRNNNKPSDTGFIDPIFLELNVEDKIRTAIADSREDCTGYILYLFSRSCEKKDVPIHNRKQMLLDLLASYTRVTKATTCINRIKRLKNLKHFLTKDEQSFYWREWMTDTKNGRSLLEEEKRRGMIYVCLTSIRDQVTIGGWYTPEQIERKEHIQGTEGWLHPTPKENLTMTEEDWKEVEAME